MNTLLLIFASVCLVVILVQLKDQNQKLDLLLSVLTNIPPEQIKELTKAVKSMKGKTNELAKAIEEQEVKGN